MTNNNSSPKSHWTLDDISWKNFDSQQVDPEMLKVIKAASLIEYNATDYGIYLSRVFEKDPIFSSHINQWVQEEIQHGKVLRRWAELADPSFDFEKSLDRFKENFRIPLKATESIRGSCVGELLARCMVETGTSSFYTALKESTSEPVLQEICQRVAADELRHYKLFYTHGQRYLKETSFPLYKRFWIAFKRLAESDDDELASAYFAANTSPGTPYQHQHFSQAYLSRVYSYYRPHHVNQGMAMIFKAIGLNPHSLWCRPIQQGIWWHLTRRLKKFAGA